MYKIAASEINRGLSLFPRILLALCSATFGAVMILVVPDNAKAPYFYAFAVFCFLIAVACITQGRARQVVGSVVGAAIFMFTSCYLAFEIATGAPLLAARSEPSIRNAALCLMFFGVPGAAYAWRVRFGFGAPAVEEAPPGANV